MAESCGGCSSGAVGGAVAAALRFFATAQCLLSEPWPPEAFVYDGARADVIVVGGGTAGAALAARLAETPGLAVLLIEAGGDPPQEAIIPTFKDFFKGSEYDWNFTTVWDGHSGQALEGGRQRQPRGRMLGGSGSLNDMVYARGFPADYEEWAARLGPLWSWPSVLPYFKKSEDLVDERFRDEPGLAQYHGFGGPIRVTGTNASLPATERFLAAFVELGFDIAHDMTNPECRGARVGKFSHTIRDGRRDSTATAMLNVAARRWPRRLHVLKHTLVTRILFDGDSAVGVEAIRDGERLRLYADKEVVISAGAFNSPKLLMLSGVGPADHLRRVGLPVTADLPVGHNLHDHVLVPLFFVADNGTCPLDRGNDNLQLLRYLHDAGGPYAATDSMGAYLVLGETHSDTAPDFAIYPTCQPAGSFSAEGCRAALGLRPDACELLERENESHELISMGVVLLRPRSRGRVLLASADPLEPPLIHSGTFADDADLAGFPEAMDTAAAAMRTSGFASLATRELRLDVIACRGAEGEERRRCEARSVACAAWHAAGTASMGPVLDERMRVRGLRRLRVVDASAMPHIVRGNTNAPVVMLAERAAQFFAEEHGFSNAGTLATLIHL